MVAESCDGQAACYRTYKETFRFVSLFSSQTVRLAQRLILRCVSNRATATQRRKHNGYLSAVSIRQRTSFKPYQLRGKAVFVMQCCLSRICLLPLPFLSSLMLDKRGLKLLVSQNRFDGARSQLQRGQLQALWLRTVFKLTIQPHASRGAI